MANVALYARKALNAQALTRAERAKLRQSLDDLAADSGDMLHAAALPDAMKARVLKDLEKVRKPRQTSSDEMQSGEVAELEHLVVRSGIRTIEFLLNQRSIVA